MKKLIALLVALMMLGTAVAALADTVTVAFNPEYPPFEYVNDNGEYEGYDVDLINAVAEKAGIEIAFEAMDFDAVISAVATNPNTIGVSGISITDERKLSVDFSEGYINAGLIVVVKKDSGYATVDDLKGKVIGVQMGTTSDFAAEEITGEANTSKYKTFLNAIMELQGNKVDAVIVDKPVGIAILNELKDDALEIVDMGLQADWYGIEVNKENPELLEKINAALKELEAEGFYKTLEDKFFTDTGADAE
ncbi:MAG: basic amino acid ABC transporter substrate-binding protein [Clostridia bacterium]|nr:basic amino acid ABC transporter substrate-binding protein [Clostridia bacterium]